VTVAGFKERCELRLEDSLHLLHRVFRSFGKVTRRHGWRQSCGWGVTSRPHDLAGHLLEDVLELVKEHHELLVVFLRMSAVELIAMEGDAQRLHSCRGR
jgi:hypothetical protein